MYQEIIDQLRKEGYTHIYIDDEGDIYPQKPSFSRYSPRPVVTEYPIGYTYKTQHFDQILTFSQFAKIVWYKN